MRTTRLAFLSAAGLAVLANPAGAQRFVFVPTVVKIPAIVQPATPASVRTLLTVIAADSMEGRAVWMRGSDRAAKYIAEQMRRIGLVPGGDSGYFQKIPGALQSNGRVQRLLKLSDLDTVPADRRRLAVNVVGLLPRKPGATGADSIVVIDAHYDHIGIRPAIEGDSIANGADDDASGTVAVLEIARIMKQWTAPSRTVVFLATTGEESGLVGTGWYLLNPVRPLAAMASNLEIEMIGRPDTLTVGAGRAWLTGFERSTMGMTFQANGLPILADMRPTQRFFSRSDNAAFARMGIPAHTLSSFNLHTDYHQVSDEVSKVDFDHMAALINIGAKASWVLTETPAPIWVDGMRPCPSPPGRGGGGGAGAAGRGGLAAAPAQPTPAQRDSVRAALDSARIAAQFPQGCVVR
jgi:hypothetical protein